MAESSDYSPGVWSGHDFGKARATFDSNVGRAYDDAVSKNKGANDLVPDELSTDSEAPCVIVSDVTGSMGEWPKTIFSKLPYLEHEGKKEYFNDTFKISFCAFGDEYEDKYPLQVRPFTDGLDLKKQLGQLVVEGGGGGQTYESPELAAIYYTHNVKIPKAVHPIFIIITDEGSHETDTEKAEQWAKAKVRSRTSTKKLFEDLKQKYSVYVVLKPYGGESDPDNARIRKQWVDLLGSDHVASLPDPNRVVDVIFGIFAKETGKVEYFEEELQDRQGKDKGGDKKIDVVMKSLVTIYDKDAVNKTTHKSLKKLPAPKGASVTVRKGGGTPKNSISLLDD